MISRNILPALLLILCVISCSPMPSGDPETQTLVDEFFKTYKTKGHEEAIRVFLNKNKWVTNKDAADVGIQMNEIVSQIGKYYGEEQIAVRTYGKNFIQYIYIAKYERQPLKFIFKFYRPGDKWQVQSFNYEVDLMPELDEAGKAYRLRENNN